MKLKTGKTLAILALAALLWTAGAKAQEEISPPQAVTAGKAAGVDILPAKSLSQGDITADMDIDNPTHPPIRLTPDKSDILKLDQDAATIIVGNPNHLSILADNARTLILVGRAPGATHFTALDAKGNIIMQRHVIVASPKEKYVRIRRSCNADVKGCKETQVYYCPDMCHEIITGSGSSDSAGSSGGGSAAATAKATEDLVEKATKPAEDTSRGTEE